MAKIRVFIADDHAVLRAGLRMLINSQPDMEVCNEAADGREALRKASCCHPDVLVMDLSMPGAGGIQAIETLRRLGLCLRVLVLSMHSDPAYVRSALAAGAAGYVAKGSVDAELLSGIRAVHQGKTFLDPSLAGAILPSPFGPPGGPQPGEEPLQRLSHRERQVLELLTCGHTNQQVADRLFLSVKTAETYRARLAKKLGLRSRADFVRYGLESGLLSRPTPSLEE